jgi:hypothetical protein
MLHMKQKSIPSLRIATVPGPVIAVLLFGACDKEEPPPPLPQPMETVAEASAPFVPSEDGLLSEEQARNFVTAHRAMAEVNAVYLDSLVGAPPETQRSINQAMDIAREKVARRYGLNGYAEYRWILEVAPRREENRAVLERLQVTTIR